MRFRSRLVLASLLLVNPLGPAALFGEVTKSVRASGLAVVIEGDRAAAFQQAKAAAMREAVEEAMGTLITAETMVRNFAVIEDHILSGTTGYISEFSIVEHGVQDDTTYLVVIDASVSLGSLHASIDGLKLLLEAIDHPRIVCISRLRIKAPDGSMAEDWGRGTAALQQSLQAAQGEMELLKPKLEASVYENVMDDPAAAASWAQREGADIVVLAQIAVQGQKNLPIPFGDSKLADLSIHSVAASAQVEAFWCDSREVLTTISALKRAAGSSFENAAQIAMDAILKELSTELVGEMVENWRQKVYSGRTISLTVKGNRRLADYFEREFPLRVAGIEKLYPRSFKADLAVYDVRSKTPAFQVARELSAKGLGDLDIEIVQVTPNTMRLELSN